MSGLPLLQVGWLAKKKASSVPHKVYSSIVNAVKTGRLKEPFTSADFRRACPGIGEGTYQTFLHKHRVENPGGNSELFKQVAPGRYTCARPFKYGF